MSRTVQELLVLATKFEKLAVDIPQPEDFEEDFVKWLKMKEKGPPTVREMPAIRLVEPKPGAVVMDDLPFDPSEFDKDEEGLEADDHDAKLGVGGHPFDVDKEDVKGEARCHACNGEGYKNGKFCTKCEGSGHAKSEKHHDKAAALQMILVAKKQEKKLDPKAKVRNRGTVCVPASSAKDKKDHFPINSEAQARNALARVHQYKSVPSWYSGSLKSLQELVSRKVHSKYKGIGKSDKKKKSALQVSQTLLTKYAK